MHSAAYIGDEMCVWLSILVGLQWYLVERTLSEKFPKEFNHTKKLITLQFKSAYQPDEKSGGAPAALLFIHDR